MFSDVIAVMRVILRCLHRAVKLRQNNCRDAVLPGIPQIIRMRGNQQFDQLRLDTLGTDL